MKLLNVEDVEQFYPVVYLYRQELRDSSGAGRYRGGVGMKFAFIPAGVPVIGCPLKPRRLDGKE